MAAPVPLGALERLGLWLLFVSDGRLHGSRRAQNDPPNEGRRGDGDEGCHGIAATVPAMRSTTARNPRSRSSMVALQWNTIDGTSASRGYDPRMVKVTARSRGGRRPAAGSRVRDPIDGATLGRVQHPDARREDNLDPDLDE